MKKLRRILLNLCFKTINYLLKETNMSVSIDDLMSRKVLPNVGISNFSPIIRGKTWNYNSVVYELVFPDGTELNIKIEYLNDALNYGFISTTIVNLDMLTDVLTKLMFNLRIHSSEMESYLFVHIKNHTK